MVLVDDYLGHPWVYFMKNKSEAQTKYNNFKTDVKSYYETEVGHFKFSVNFIKFFRTDGAPELAGGPTASKTFIDQLRREGTFKEDSAADTQSQDGVAERMIKSINYNATSMLIDSGLPKNFWAEAVNTATFMQARRPSSSQGGKSPWTKMTGRRIDPSMWRPFGCPAYAHLEKPKRDGKFASKAVKCIMLGYAPGMKAYRLFNLRTRKIFASRHVTFDEAGHIDNSIFPPEDNLHDPSQSQWEDLLQDDNLEDPLQPDQQISGSISDNSSDSSDDEDYPSASAPQIPTANSESISVPPTRRSEPRISRIPIKTKIIQVEQIVPPIPSITKVSVPSTAPSTRLTASRVRPTPPVNSRQSMGPPPAPKRPSTPPTRFVAGSRRSSRTVVPQRKNADFIKATDQHNQKLADAKAKRNIPLAPSPSNSPGPPPPPDKTNTIPSGSDLDAVIEDLMEGKGGDADLNGDIDVTEAMFAFLSSSGVTLSPSGMITPETLQEAYESAQAPHWRKAMMEEIRNLDDNDVYETVPVPEGVKPISTKPVMKIKLDKNGNIERFKIRIVARGFVQRKGVNYEETFAPVANLESIRIICALAAKYDLELDQMDVSTAYLNGVLNEEIYISPPEGVPIQDGFCWKLKKSIYGLKQAGRTWNRTLDAALTQIGFQQLNAETCLYVFRGDGGEVCFLVVYVDDLLLAASTTKFMRTIKAKLQNAFKMRDLGPASFILGLEIIRDRKNHTIALSQAQYVDKVLERCGMTDCSIDKTPMRVTPRVSATDPEDNTIRFQCIIGTQLVSYATVVGSLMYAMLGTRPDLAHVVGILGRYSSAPKSCHWEIAKRALRYLKGTREMQLTYHGTAVDIGMDFHGWTDADWCGDSDTSKSTSGFVFISNGGAIGWSSKRQTMVALSSTESEYIGLSNAGQHLMWLRTFYEELGHSQPGPTKLYCDNQAAIILTKDPQYRTRTMHIERKFHFVRDDVVGKGKAIVSYVPTRDMVADIFTKALPTDSHWKFVTAMGLKMPSSGSERI
jgi:hypothetical protein